jgi:signal transduction histidine kinase
LRRLLIELRREGSPFSLTILGPNGRFLEADGRTAGARAVLWLTDATVKGIEESAARRRVEELRDTISIQPEAFVEMLAKTPFPAWRQSGGGRLEWANTAYLAACELKDLETARVRNVMIDPSFPELARRALEGGHLVEELRHIVVRGQRRAMRVVAFPVSGAVAGMTFDATDEENARQALQRHVKAHDETLNHLADGVAIFGANKRLIFYNSAFAKIWDLEEAWLSEQPTHGALLDRLRERRRLPARSDYAAWRAGELAHYQNADELPEDLWVLPDGRTLRVARQRHPHGGLLLLFEDRTDELSLRAQYNSLIEVQKATLDKLREGVAVFGSDGRLRLRNAAFETLWDLDSATLGAGVTFDDLVDMMLPLFHDRDQWAEIKARITDPSPEARQTHGGELSLSNDKSVIFLTHPLPDGATLVAFVDITDSRRVERALTDRAEALEAADHLKTEFIETVSYQLRTPLTTVQGYAELLEAGVFGELQDAQKEQMGAILAATGQLSHLVETILDLALIEAGRIDLDFTEVDLGEVLRETAEMEAPRAREAQVELKLDLEKGLAKVRADRRRIAQAAMSLVSNALRFSETGGVITLGAKREGDTAKFWVADTGRGMDPEIQAEAFHSFVSGDKRGAGLGLALVREFVELHGGWVALQSEPGKGTVVSCHLPTTLGIARGPTPEELLAQRAQKTQKKKPTPKPKTPAPVGIDPFSS